MVILFLFSCLINISTACIQTITILKITFEGWEVGSVSEVHASCPEALSSTPSIHIKVKYRDVSYNPVSVGVYLRMVPEAHGSINLA